MKNAIIILQSLAIIWLIYKVLVLDNKTKPLADPDVKVFTLETINAISWEWYNAGRTDCFNVQKAFTVIDSINKTKFFIKTTKK